MSVEKRPLKVFLCHAHDDQVAVRSLYKRLVKDGIDAWLDKEKLFGGANWEYEIRKAVRESDVVIVCLSKQFSAGGFRQKEVQIALDEAALKPKEEIFIIPVRLEECDVPEQLEIWHWLDLFRRGGYYKLMGSLKSRGLQLQRAKIEIPNPDETIPTLAKELKPEQTKNIFVNVDGNVQGNVIIGNENSVQSQTFQPIPEKQIEPKLPVVIEKKESERPVSPPPIEEKGPQKSHRKLKAEYMFVIGPLLALLIGVLTQIIKPTPEPTAIFTATSPATMTFTYVATATLTALSPSETLEPSLTPESSLAPTEAYTLTISSTPLPEVYDPHPMVDDYHDAFGVPMRLVPAGTFTMGAGPIVIRGADLNPDENPNHKVYLNDFYFDKYEVTNILFKACVDAGMCKLPKHLGDTVLSNSYFEDHQYDNYPLVYVDWYQAKAYCEWRGAGLPTEAQWEKTAQGAGWANYYPWGNRDIDCGKANYYDGTQSKYCVGTTTGVGSFSGDISPYGVYDMAGNVREWVMDWYSSTYYRYSIASNPSGPNSGQYRVLRGGAWSLNQSASTVKDRSWDGPSANYNYVGFRCARDAQP